MGTYTTRPVTETEYKTIIDTLRSGFLFNGIKYRPNKQAAFSLILETNTGMRISDILNMTQNSIKKNGKVWQLDVTEIKTGKKRNYIVPDALKTMIDHYCKENNIPQDRKIFQVGERAIQKHLKACIDFLQLENVSTHSFRKLGACNFYEKSGNDIMSASQFLQHANTKTTMAYLNRSSEHINNVINQSILLV
ncbi:MAG: tyrosine-type recombinase/integrase [Lachnospiraceae bacterium]|nr:tyrosine-type recombinase/integrase [Lachnospiraceae bacterium]